MDTLKDALFGEGGLIRVRAIIAFALTGTLCYLAIDGADVPDWLLGVAGPAIGFYFGTRAGETGIKIPGA